MQTATILCELCGERESSTHIGSLWPDGLDGPCYGPFAVCGVCSRKPPEQLYALVRRTAGDEGE